MKRKPQIIWRLIVALSFCLNVFGGWQLGIKWFNKMPWVKRQALFLMGDGVKFRITRYFND